MNGPFHTRGQLTRMIHAARAGWLETLADDIRAGHIPNGVCVELAAALAHRDPATLPVDIRRPEPIKVGDAA